MVPNDWAVVCTLLPTEAVEEPKRQSVVYACRDRDLIGFSACSPACAEVCLNRMKDRLTEAFEKVGKRTLHRED
ncbi:MAG: hypothetical protein Q7J06_04375, partial [Bacteroidales bacterium]|nr:hypothetical protein [Bacteroidales bacterium]